MAVTGTEIAAEVRKFLGYPYVYGDAGPAAFDCSGLVQFALTHLGFRAVPRTSEAQWGWVTKISRSQLQTGDLVFAQFPGDNASPGHVGVYVGGGQVLSAEDPAQGVGLASLSSWGGNIVGYGRPPGAAKATGSGGGGLLSLFLPSDVTDMFSTATQFVQGLMWLVNPENTARIIAGIMGVFLGLFGLGFLIAAGA